jgi:hypothetical protein
MVVGMFQITEKTYPILKNNTSLLLALQNLQISFPDPKNLLQGQRLEHFIEVMGNSEKIDEVETAYTRQLRGAKKTS